jgi:DNA invertase Pin-like site-specific DNA recombinase
MTDRRAVAYIPAQRAGEPIVDGAWKGVRLDVVDTVRGEAARDAASARVGEALRRIAAGEASVLLVARLADAAASAHELLALLDWLDAAGADLVALDVRLDTASSAGRRTVATLREIERWKQTPAPDRRPRGRPGLAATAPQLGERVAALRERGLSLQAIADALNADGVPTQRGGARWRPSSVQSVLGYRRPRPPLPGAPPLPPPGHMPPHPPHPRHLPPDGRGRR